MPKPSVRKVPMLRVKMDAGAALRHEQDFIAEMGRPPEKHEQYFALSDADQAIKRWEVLKLIQTMRKAEKAFAEFMHERGRAPSNQEIETLLREKKVLR